MVKFSFFQMPEKHLVWDKFWEGKLDGLILNSQDTGENEEELEKEVSVPQESDFFCRTCVLSLSSREEQISHYKSDQHRKNLRSKLRTRNDSQSESDSDDRWGPHLFI